MRLSEILDRVDNGSLALPTFQRGIRVEPGAGPGAYEFAVPSSSRRKPVGLDYFN